TGETGAGKSIIVGALALILGQRADGSVIVNKDRKCFVEGIFGITNKGSVREYLKENEWDDGEQLIIRREVGFNGKSRAFVNDSPVTLSQLNVLSSLLVDLHQQFDTLRLGDSDFQREVLDALAADAELLRTYQQGFTSWQVAKQSWEGLRSRKLQFEKEFDYNQFQFNELTEAGLKENELEELDTQLKLLNNAEGIKTALERTYNDLKENETPIIQQLKILLGQLHSYSDYHPALPALIQRMQSVQIELQDIADETGRVGDHVHYDPERIEQINERLSVGYKLLKKHGVKSTNELLRIQQVLAEKLQSVLDIDAQLRAKEKEMGEMRQQISLLAAKISNERNRQINPLEEKVNDLLSQVGMPNARLKVNIRTADDFNFYGVDIIDFLFDGNLAASKDSLTGAEGGQPGQFQPLRKVASGGELSRLMLCIKSLVAQSVDLPTLIFD